MKRHITNVISQLEFHIHSAFCSRVISFFKKKKKKKKKIDNFKMLHNSHLKQKIHSLHMKGHNMEKNSILTNVTLNLTYLELKAT